jgi:7,8-dihydropterin-6-yl-methyl-4-(beta-D-ribofuranosyl)aminobenzene 5'-phosphate synthase
MPAVEPVDKVEILAVIDNATDSLSSIPAHAESEFAYLARTGMRELAGDSLCCACHGLSYLITGQRGDSRRTVLFDAGPEEYAFERNCARLGVDLGTVESIVLSHGHWDHGGGMLKALDLIRARNGNRPVPYYAHPGMFRSRARKLPDGRMQPSKDVPDVETLARRGARVVNTRAPQTFLDAMFFLSGEIPRVTPFERGLAGHYQRTEGGSDWAPDPLLIDERFLAVHAAGKGILVFTACSHAGVINVLTHARSCFPGVPLYAVAGGFHLVGPNEPIIPETVAAMKDFSLRVIAAGHCTGWRAITALVNAFGDSIVDPSVVGKRLTF